MNIFVKLMIFYLFDAILRKKFKKYTQKVRIICILCDKTKNYS